MSVLAPEADDGAGRRMALALLVAFGLHAVLLLGVPADWRLLHFPAPRRFEVLLLPAQRSATPEPAAAPEPVAPEVPPEAPVTVTRPEPGIPLPVPAPAAPPTPPLPEPVVVATPTPPAPPVSAIVTRPAPKPTGPSKPIAPAKPVKPPPREPPAKPAARSRAVVPPPVKPAAPTTAKPGVPAPADQPAPAMHRPDRPERAGGAAARPSSRVDSAALLGQIASIEADTERKASAGIRVKRVSLTDTRSLAGFYAADWARKVTRVGEMNFPDAARRLDLSTGPLLEVAIRADGSLQQVRVTRSSGNAELDRAARRIVELAAPYPPFPPELRQQADLLKIESPWRFDPGGRIQAR